MNTLFSSEELLNDYYFIGGNYDHGKIFYNY